MKKINKSQESASSIKRLYERVIGKESYGLDVVGVKSLKQANKLKQIIQWAKELGVNNYKFEHQGNYMILIFKNPSYHPGNVIVDFMGKAENSKGWKINNKTNLKHLFSDTGIITPLKKDPRKIRDSFK